MVSGRHNMRRQVHEIQLEHDNATTYDVPRISTINPSLMLWYLGNENGLVTGTTAAWKNVRSSALALVNQTNTDWHAKIAAN